MRADVQNFPSAHRQSEQRAIDRWRQRFNQVRPHEAIGGKVPADLDRAGTRRSVALVRFEYPPTWIVRRIFRGKLSLNGEHRFVSRALTGYRVGLQPGEAGRYRVWFGDVDLGELEPSVTTAQIDDACEHFFAKRAPLRA